VSSLSVQLLVLVPAAAALAGLLLRTRRPLSGLVAAAASGLTVLLSLLQWATTEPGARTVATIGPLATGELAVPLHLLTDRAAALIAFAVALVGLAVQVFSIWYLRDDPRYPVFAATVSLFLAAMLLVVQSGDLILTLIGWEVMGWCSYLLIGHTSTRESARRAAHKALLVTCTADIGFIVGLVILGVGARSTDIASVLEFWAGPQQQATAGLRDAAPGLTAALVGLLIGIAGKSGLIPFHDWLPDAMEGPTPASALIHAATMVAAGSYVIARFFPLYAASGAARLLLAVLAGVTMVWAALLAFAQSDVKRLLAYSTLSQVAMMLAALAVVPAADGPAPGLAHLFSHALFKSLLFLAIGWLSVIAGGTAFAVLRGTARGRGGLQVSLAVGLLALAGVPPLVGFFSKESVIGAAEAGLQGKDSAAAWVVLAALVLTVPLTAAYCTRAWLVVSARPLSPTEEADLLADVEGATGQAESDALAAPAGDDRPTARHVRSVSGASAVVVFGLAVLTVVGGLFLPAFEGPLHLGLTTAVLSLLLIGGAAAAVRAVAPAGADPAVGLGPRWGVRSDQGFGVDRAYVAVGRAVLALARLVVVLDEDVVDAYPRGAARLSGLLGTAAGRRHRGASSPGLVALVIGVVALAVAGVTVWH